MKKKISLIMAAAMMLSTFATASVGAEEVAASSGASIAFDNSARVVDSIEITSANLTEDAIAALNVKDAAGNYSTEPVDLNGWTFQRTIPDGDQAMKSIVADTNAWKSKKWLIINNFAQISNNTALPELNGPFSIDYTLGTDSNNSYIEFGDFAAGNYYRMNFRIDGTITENETKYYKTHIRIERYDNGIVAFENDVTVNKRTTQWGVFPFIGTITYDGTNLILSQDSVSDVVVNADWENWEMWPSRVSSNIRVGTGNCKLYLNKLTVTSAAQNTTVNDFVLNRTFTGADTEAALEAEGWDVTMANSVGTASALYATKVFNNSEIGGNITVEAKAKKGMNETYIYLRYDGTTGYRITSKLYSKKFVECHKLVDGKWVSMGQETKTMSDLDATFKATIEDIGDNVKLTLTLIVGDKEYTPWEWLDEKSDTNTPIKTAGKIGYETSNKYAGTTYLTSIKAYPTATGSKEVSDVDVKYLMNNTEIETIEADGAVYMKMPTAILGQDFSIICALYEDGVMKGITQVAPIEAYNANGVKLFNTTGLSGKVSVKTFIWSGINQMQALTTPKGL